jgi:transcriptional regulator with XRE-family HTH domain
MGREKPILLKKHQDILTVFGENIKLARLRRRLTKEQVSERANISRPTLNAIEQGSESVSLGSYFQVLMIFGLEKDILQVGKDDEFGRKLQDAGLINKK